MISTFADVSVDLTLANVEKLMYFVFDKILLLDKKCYIYKKVILKLIYYDLN